MKNHWLLVVILTVATALRLANLDPAPYFSDMDWFFTSARQALTTGYLPILGITASITWLHQGPLWTYLLLLPTAIGLPPQILTIIAGVAAVALAYFAARPVAAVILALLPFAVTVSQTAYHTSLIPLLFFLSFLCFCRRRLFLAGLFVGWLYQAHLLTFIYWPLWLYLVLKLRLRLPPVLLGFGLGILPFIIAGPVQLFGIFVWLAKQLLAGFSGVSSGISTAYWVVLLPGLILALGWVIKWLSAYRNSFGQKRDAEPTRVS